jgi:lipopolysaccharide transport system ATP-binding protein
VEGVSKKFCRSLKRSLWYGVCDIAGELSPFGRRPRSVERRVSSDESLAAARRRASGVEPSTLDSGPSTHDHDGLRPGEFWAVKDVSFELRRGECLGLIGHNGAGKTTLLKMLNGLIKPDRGRIEMNGRVGALIALGAGFNPILTGRENIYINGSVLGLSKKEIDEKLDEIIDFAEIGELIDMPVQNYSSGMQVRLGFAVATALDPDILILDEVLAVGDLAFRAKCFKRIGDIINSCSVIFVSHDLVQVSRICDRCLYLKQGVKIITDRSDKVISAYIKDSSKRPEQKSLSTDNNVDKFAVEPISFVISAGSFAQLTLELGMHKPEAIGLALLALTDGEISVAQSDITEILNKSLDGDSYTKVMLALGPINLKKGVYGLSVTILSESRKRTLAHAINCARLTVSGAAGYGVYYQFPVSQSCETSQLDY